MFSEIQNNFLINIIRVIIKLYTYATLPVYYIVQKPWKTLEKSRVKRAVQIDSQDAYSSWIRAGKVPPIDSVIKVQTVDLLLEKAAETYGKNYAICAVKLGSGKCAYYQWITYGAMIRRVNDIAKGLHSIGIKNNDLVLIFAETRVEWMLFAFAVYKLGASITTLFDQLGKEGIIRGINQTRVKYVITTKHQIIKLKEVLPKTPCIRKIVDIDNGCDNNVNYCDIEIISLKSLEIIGRKCLFELPKVSLNTGDDIAVIMYTSGTTGSSKGVIALHSNLIASVKTTLSVLWHIYKEKHTHRYIAYLPLSHMFEFIFELFCFSTGIRLGYSSSSTLIAGSHGLTANHISDLRLLKPTFMCAVPLVLHRLENCVFQQIESNNKVKRLLFKLLIQYKVEWRSRGYRTPICNLILCRKARQLFGSCLDYMFVGGAELSIETQKSFAIMLDMVLMKVFGCTEVCCTSHVPTVDNLEFGHIGAPVYGCNVKLIDWMEGGYRVNDKPNTRGEILISGQTVSKGYYMMKKETNNAFRLDSNEKMWYYTGDIAEVLPNGTFRIIDRRKDLIKLQNGEYVSLGKIEALLKSCTYVDNICVSVCSTKDIMVAIVLPNHKSVLKLAKKIGLVNNDCFEQLCANKKIVSTVSEAIGLFGKKKALSNREIPVMYMLTALQWTPDNDMLTAAFKLKRINIIKYYKTDLQNMFDTCIDINKNTN